MNYSQNVEADTFFLIFKISVEISFSLSSEHNFQVCFSELLGLLLNHMPVKTGAKNYNLIRISFDYLNFCYKS